MKLTHADVERIAAMCPSGHVTRGDECINIDAHVDEDGDIKIIGEVMRAALELRLDPSQVVNRSSHTEFYQYSEWTSGGGYTHFGVTFLFEPKAV